MKQIKPTAAAYFDAMRAVEMHCGDALKTLPFALLPPSAQELARTIGLPSALKMVEMYGGLTLRIPHGETPQGRAMLEDITKNIGDAPARALAQRYAGTALVIPNCKLSLQKARDAALHKDRDALAREGLTERQLVQCLTLRYRLTERYVWRILKKPTPDIPEPQMQQASLLG